MLNRLLSTVVPAGAALVLLTPVRSAIGAVVLPPDATTQQAPVVRGDQTISRTLRFAASGPRRLEIRVLEGSIHVTGWDNPEVQVEVRRRTDAETDSDRAAADREVALEFVEERDIVAAVVRDADGTACGEPTVRRTWRRPYRVTTDVTVRVPRGTALRLCSVSGGEIRVEQTEGDFTVNNVNGRITMEGIRGSGVAETVNGRVSVSFREPPSRPTRLKTVNGDVTGAFPPTLSADLAMKTFNGGLYSDFDVVALAAAPVAVERRGTTSIYRSNDFTRMRAGSGGPEITFETFNGDVRIVRASR